MTKIRLNTQVQGKLPANSLYDWDETINWNKAFTWNLLRWDTTTTTGNYVNIWSPNSTSNQIDSYTNWFWFRDLLLNGWNLTLQSNGNTKVNSIFPSIDNSYSCGASGKRWSEIWAANWTIQTSDKRTKTDITPTTLWLDFINKLNPVSYKWIEWWKEVTYEEIEIEKEIQEEKEIKYTEKQIELVDWKYTEKEIEKTRYEKVFDEVDLYNEYWEIIGKHKIPKMITKKVIERKEVIISNPWKRKHFWFIAQEVEEALEWTDFGWLVIDENGQYALRYDQFISPLVAAVKELKARMEFLENKVN